MAPIRSHNKSRKGCRTCKKKVKCDETGFPICRNCTNREIACDWPANLAPSSDSFSSLDEPSASDFTQRMNSPPQLDPNSNGMSLPISVSSRNHTFDMANMELLHHWTTETCLWILDDDHALHHLQAYQITTPRMAVAYPSLMHAILSITSMHIHSLGHTYVSFGPPRDYYGLALYHRRKSQEQTLTPCPEKTCPGDDHCPTVATAQFMANLLLSMFEFGATTLDVGFDGNRQLTQFIVWMENHRKNLSAYFFSHRNQLNAGPLANMLNLSTIHASSQKDIPMNSPAFLRPIAFPTSLHSIANVHTEDSDIHSIGSAEVYQEAVRSLEHVHKIFSCSSPLRALTSFPAILPSKFLLFLHERRYRALVILAHFCGLFQESRELTQKKLGWWWGNGRIDFVLLIRGMLTEKWQLYLDRTMIEARANGRHLDVPQDPALYTKSFVAAAAAMATDIRDAHGEL
ncbi:hypothetical protein DL96DRAFT_1818715 [Flagelloscypha sp. PMI_526]|nr:hypothetical protein DL96DRAFT_1818715 [Flagelloscypha sp. PMI_526]